MSIQSPQPLGDHLRLQDDCTGRLMGGNLSPNTCHLTHFQKNQLRFAKMYLKFIQAERLKTHRDQSESVCANGYNLSAMHLFAVGDLD